jgi:ribosomal protein L6P/L9E
MSRIGKLPITIPENVDVNYNNQKLQLKENLEHYKQKFQMILILHKIMNS